MKNVVQSALVRGLCALILGVLLVVVSDRMPVWMVMACGLLFVVPGVVALIGWFRRDASLPAAPLSPVSSVGSILLGTILLLFPASFVTILMYMLAALVLLAAATQLYSVYSLHRRGMPLSLWYGVVPMLTLGAGIYVLFRPSDVAALPFIVIGAASILYGLLELWAAFLLGRHVRQLKRTAVAV